MLFFYGLRKSLCATASFFNVPRVVAHLVRVIRPFIDLSYAFESLFISKNSRRGPIPRRPGNPPVFCCICTVEEQHVKGADAKMLFSNCPDFVLLQFIEFVPFL